MNELERIKKYLFKHRFIALIIIGVIAIIYIGDLSDSLGKLKSIFKKEKSDTMFVKLVENQTFPTIEPDTKGSFPDPDTIPILKKISFIDLIKGFINEDDSTCQAWSVQSNNDAIYWVTEGVEFGSNYDELFRGDCPLIRTGYCILTHNGKDVYKILRKREEPGKWQIILCGPRAGVYKVYISNCRMSGEISPGLIKEYFSKYPDTEYLNVYNEVDGMEGSLRYKMKIINKKEVLISEEYSCGSGGCSIRLIIEL